MEKRGRPSVQPTENKVKWEQIYNEDDRKTVWYYDNNRSLNGPYKTEIFESKIKQEKIKIDPKTYGGLSTIIVFKISDRFNTEIKMKIINKNIDYVLSNPISGVPDNAVVLELGVGEGFIPVYKQKYNLN